MNAAILAVSNANYDLIRSLYDLITKEVEIQRRSSTSNNGTVKLDVGSMDGLKLAFEVAAYLHPSVEGSWPNYTLLFDNRSA
jgi:cell division FtsZ-interacting protein ZapD